MPGGYETSPVPIGNEPYKELSNFIQIFDTKNITAISDHDFLSAPFKELCPSGNCIKDCRDLGRLFEAVPDGVDATASTYGRPDSDQRMTLFVICSDLAHFADTISISSTSTEVQDYFPLDSLSSDNVTMATTGIASCFASTCDMTREPAKCKDACSIDNFLAGPSHLNFNFQSNNTGSLACISRLCDNTCGLPYANQDVLGIGVLTTYYIQALVLIICAASFLVSAAWQTWKKPEDKPEIHKKLKGPLETLLTAQTYFGFSAAVASFVMKPASVDPLNGYALICVTIMGFLPPVFIMMLLHSHGLKSWFSSALVFASYLINTVAFFILRQNLSNIKFDDEDLRTGMKDLFSTAQCGGSSAMLLCRQLTGMEPLSYLDLFYNQGPIPNVKTIPILWGWTTLVLFVLLAFQLRGSKRSEKMGSGREKLTTARPQNQQDSSSRVIVFIQLPMARILLLLTASLLFCLCLAYQFLSIREYQDMDVIDRNGWSFGQVVAVLFWIPPFLDIIHSVLENSYDTVPQNDNTGTVLPAHNPQGKTRPPFIQHGLSPSFGETRPLAYSPTPSPSLHDHDDTHQMSGDGSYDHEDDVEDYSTVQRRWTRTGPSRKPMPITPEIP